MHQSPTFKKLALPLLIASALSACSSSDNNPSPSTGVQGDTATNGGAASEGSTASAYLLCHDSNLDGLCGTAENAASFETLAAAKAASVDAGTGPVIISSDASNLVTAPSTASNASGWSTLVYNESFVNPTTGNDEAAIGAYLKEKLGLDSDSGLSSTEEAALDASVVAALDANADASPYAVIGAVIEAAVLQGSLENAVPTTAQINSQTPLARVFETAPEATTKASWEASDGDERIWQIAVTDGIVMVVNRWYNRIAFVDPSATEQAIETQPFAAVFTSGHNVISDDTDYVSGASEHRIQKSWLADGGDTLYAMVRGPGNADIPEDDSYGLFRVPLNNGNLPTNMVDSVDGSTSYNVPHRAASVAWVDNKNLGDAIQLPNGNVLAYDSEAGYVRVYSADLTEDQSQAFALDRDLSGWTIANDGETLITLQGTLDGGDTTLLQAYSTSDLSETSSLTLSSDADTLLGSETGANIIVLEDTTVTVINAADLSIISSLSVGSAPSTTSRLSADGSRAALIFGSEINILNLAEAYPVFDGSVAYEGTLRALAFNGNDEILFGTGSGDGVLQSLSLADVVSTPSSIDDLLTKALDQIDADGINHDYPLEAVIYPLDLPATYGAATYDWSSTLGSALDLSASNLGAISQGSSAVTGDLTVSSSYNFRGDVSTSEDKTLELTIRAASETRDHVLTVLSGAHATHSMSKIAPTIDGQLLAAYTPGDEDGSSGIVVFQRENDDTMSYLYGGDAAISLPAGFEDSTIDVMAWNSDNTLLRIVIRDAVAAGEEDGNGTGQILTLNPATGDWNTYGPIFAGAGYKAFISEDTSVIGVWLQVPAPTEDDDEAVNIQVKTLNTDDLSEINNFNIAGTARYWAFAVDNTGSHIMTYFNYRDDEGDTYRNTRRYDADNTTGEPGASTVISTATYGYVYDNAGDRLITGDFSANVRVYPNATTATDLDTFTEFATAHGTYDGIHDSGRGRVYYGGIKGDTVYFWGGDRGLYGLDISDTDNIQEAFYAPVEDLNVGALAANGTVAYTTAFSDDDVSTIGVLAID